MKEIGVNHLSGIIDAVEHLSSASTMSTADGIAVRGKSDLMNLSFPCDWCNPDIPDNVLISKVIEYWLFEDIVRNPLRHAEGSPAG